MSDIDGTVYKTVKIGDQWWMAENLSVTRFRDGSPISYVPDSNTFDWSSGNAAYSKYLDLGVTPGLLYNWNAVSYSAGLAPAGWRIPTDEDWKTLEKTIGMTPEQADRSGWRGTNEAEKLKLEANEGWEFYENIWATNESGFSADAGSCRMFNGEFGYPGLKFQGFWWTSTESGTDHAWYRHLYYKEDRVFRYNGLKQYGFSVRCVKN